MEAASETKLDIEGESSTLITSVIVEQTAGEGEKEIVAVGIDVPVTVTTPPREVMEISALVVDHVPGKASLIVIAGPAEQAVAEPIIAASVILKVT